MVDQVQVRVVPSLLHLVEVDWWLVVGSLNRAFEPRNAQLVCVLADEGIQLSALALIRLVELQGGLATLPVTLHARVGDVALVRLLTLVNQF